MEKAAAAKAVDLVHNFSENLKSLEDVGAVYLLLGTACNMSCRHCVQTPIKGCLNLSPHGKELSQEVKDFIVNWSNLPWKYAENNPRRLYFWGGEPLLYWETIKKLVLEFKKIGVKNVSYRIFSNGLLLNDEIVNFCNEHDIWFILSYDAPNARAARNAVPGKEACKKFLRIRKRTVNTVFNAINDNMVEAFEWLEYTFPGTEITCGFMNVLSENTPLDLYQFKTNAVKKAVKNLWLIANSDSEIAPYIRHWFNSKILRVRDFNKEEFYKYPYPPCRPAVVSLSINFNGEIMLCHNTDKIVGHITDDFAKLQEKHRKFFEELLPIKCKTCEHLDICRCICPIGVKKDGELCYCDYLREFWSAIKECYKPLRLKCRAGGKYKIIVNNDGEFELEEVVGK